MGLKEKAATEETERSKQNMYSEEEKCCEVNPQMIVRLNTIPLGGLFWSFAYTKVKQGVVPGKPCTVDGLIISALGLAFHCVSSFYNLIDSLVASPFLKTFCFSGFSSPKKSRFAS